MRDTTRTQCRICGQNSSFNNLHYKTNGGHGLVKCTYCQTVTVDSRPTAEELQETYNQLFESGGYKQHRDEFEALLAGRPVKRPYQTKILRRIERVTPGRRLIEIGGGAGAFGTIASSRGWDYCDYDISATAVDFSRKLGLDAAQFDESDLPPLARNSDSADVIVMWEVLEHIWPVHDYLLRLRESLRPNGLIVISTPNLKRRGYMSSLGKPGLSSPPIHLNFFTRTSLEVTLRTAGFTRIDLVSRKIYRPQLNLRSIIRHFRIAVGAEETKTLYAIGRL